MTEFRAAVGGITFTTDGAVKVSLMVPWQYRDEAVRLADAYGLEIAVKATRPPRKPSRVKDLPTVVDLHPPVDPA